MDSGLRGKQSTPALRSVSLSVMFVCPECGANAPGGGFCTEDGVPLASSNDSMLGRSIGSHRVARLIGSGGMGRVYMGVHPTIRSRVAIKVLSPAHAESASAVERFFDEARAVNVVRHEHIVNILDLSVLPDGQPYIVMEYLDGRPLSSLIKEQGPLPLGSLVKLIVEVADALSCAHDKGVIHRDLKPDNIMVSPSGHAKILDFGVAKLRPEITRLDGATRTGALLGTPYYMSPEQARGQPVDARSDLYSVGVILYEGICGTRPFDADTLYELLRQHVEARPADLTSSRADVPSALQAVVLRALEKDPAARHQSAAELGRALEEAAASLPSASFAALGSIASSVPSTPVATALPSPGITTHASAVAARPLDAPARGSGSMLPWIGVGAVGLFLGGLALAGVVAYLGLRPSDDPPTGPRARAAPTAAAPTSAASRDAVDDKSRGFDPKRFDPWSYYPTAERLARGHYPDAALVRIDLNGIGKQGLVDFTAGGPDKFFVMYRFRSPARSVRPASLPSNVVYEGKCQVFVGVGKGGSSNYVSQDVSCEEPIISKPRCAPAQIWAKADQRGAPRGDVVGTLIYTIGPKGRTHWMVSAGRFMRFIPDDC